jgi:hypothetical protein
MRDIVKTFLFYAPIFILPAMSVTSSEKVKIDRILDANLFHSKSGLILKLSNVETPSLHDTNVRKRKLALKIVDYARSEILRYPLRFERNDSDSLSQNSDTLIVHLFRKYDLGKVSFNTYYLRNGFGLYVEEPLSSHSEEYRKASEQALKNTAGIWNLQRYDPDPPQRWDHRLRLTANWFRDLDADEYWLFPFPHFNFRWSWVDWQKLKSSPRLGWALEYGNYVFVLHYLKTGPEFRPVRFLWFSAEVCTVFGGIEEPVISGPYFAGQAGLIIPLSRHVRLEAEADYFDFGKDEHLTRLMAGYSLSL